MATAIEWEYAGEWTCSCGLLLSERSALPKSRSGWLGKEVSLRSSPWAYDCAAYGLIESPSSRWLSTGRERGTGMGLSLLEVFTKPILEIVEIILKNRNPRRRMQKSARALVRIHWMLTRLEAYSFDFISGLKILI